MRNQIDKEYLTSHIIFLIPKGPKQPLSGVINEESTPFMQVFVGRVGNTATLGVHEKLVLFAQPATQATCDEYCWPKRKKSSLYTRPAVQRRVVSSNS